MDKALIDALAERVERLERENRRWRWALAAAIAGVTAAMGLGVSGTKAISAQRARPEAPYQAFAPAQNRQPEGEPSIRMLKVGGRYVNWHHISHAGPVPGDQAKEQVLVLHFQGGDGPAVFSGDEAAAIRTFLNAVSFKLIQRPGEPAVEVPPPPPPASAK